MKRYVKFYICVSSLICVSCVKNQSVSYPDFDYKTVYFASQYPVRTIELGEDQFVDNSLDNEHKINIEATIGGTRENKSDVTVDYAVVDSLCNNMYFADDGPKVLPMPSSYYKLESDHISITKGNILGGVKVDLTDEFFADPLSIQNTYVIPLVLTNVTGVDSILRGYTLLDNPDRRQSGDWTKPPKDYVLYAVKFVNEWHGNYLRRGKDEIQYPGQSTVQNIVRHAQYVEQDEVNSLLTKSLSEVTFPVTFKDVAGKNVTCNLILKFDEKGDCVISSGTDGVTASGNGSFVKKGEKKSWGDVDRDALYLSYDVSMNELSSKSNDTLVVRDRGVGPEYFSPVIK